MQILLTLSLFSNICRTLLWICIRYLSKPSYICWKTHRKLLSWQRKTLSSPYYQYYSSETGKHFSLMPEKSHSKKTPKRLINWLTDHMHPLSIIQFNFKTHNFVQVQIRPWCLKDARFFPATISNSVPLKPQSVPLNPRFTCFVGGLRTSFYINILSS